MEENISPGRWFRLFWPPRDFWPFGRTPACEGTRQTTVGKNGT